MEKRQAEIFRAKIKALEVDVELIKNSLRNLAAFIDQVRDQTMLNTIFCEWYLNNASPSQQEELIAFAKTKGVDIRDSESPDFVKPENKIIIPGGNNNGAKH